MECENCYHAYPDFEVNDYDGIKVCDHCIKWGGCDKELLKIIEECNNA